MIKEKSKLRVTIVQTSLIWEKPADNLSRLEFKLKSLRKNSTDLIVFPEMFSSGFTMNANQVAESMKGESVKWMINLAGQKNCVVCGSLVIKERGNLYNRFVWVFPDGKKGHYDKRHLFGLGGESDVYVKGNRRVSFNVKGWKILPQICYDLRFPGFSRNNIGYDIIIYVANWPAKRRLAWKNLIIARAIENQSYCIGVNRIGSDGNGLKFRGDSVILDPLGSRLTDIKADKEAIETVSLDKKSLNAVRKSLPFLKDMDSFKMETDL